MTGPIGTFSGNAGLHGPDSAQGTVEVESFSGRLNKALPLTFRSSSRRHFSGRLGQGGNNSRGRVSVKTFSGTGYSFANRQAMIESRG